MYACRRSELAELVRGVLTFLEGLSWRERCESPVTAELSVQCHHVCSLYLGLLGAYVFVIM